MFCSKCGNQLNDGAKFCDNCGEPSGASTGKAFMEQLGALARTGAKGIKEAAAQAQTKAGELSASVENSQGLQQLGGKKNLFLFACGALVLNLLLLLSKTLYFGMRYFSDGTFSVIGFCSEMLDFIKEYGRYVDGATDGPIYMTVRFLEIAGILFILAAAVKTAMPLFAKNAGKPVSFKIIKIAVFCSVALTVLFMLFIVFAFSLQDGIEARLTFLGWIYIIESAALITVLFKLSPRVKKK